MRAISRLNGTRRYAMRHEPLYEAVMTDLVLMGALDKKIVESFLGFTIGDSIQPPAAFLNLQNKEEAATVDE